MKPKPCRCLIGKRAPNVHGPARQRAIRVATVRCAAVGAEAEIAATETATAVTATETETETESEKETEAADVIGEAALARVLVTGTVAVAKDFLSLHVLRGPGARVMYPKRY